MRLLVHRTCPALLPFFAARSSLDLASRGLMNAVTARDWD